MGIKKFKLKFKKHKYKHKSLKKWANSETGNVCDISDTQGVDRLVESKIYSRCFLREKYINKINCFSEVRDYCLGYLQKVVSDNCMHSEYHVSKHHVSSLSLELEQYALLACLELKIYQKSISKIVNEIEKCTQRKEIHEEIKKLLPELIKNTETNCIIKTEKSTMSATENYSQIPIISSTRTDNETQDPSREVHNPEANSYENQIQVFPDNEVLDSHTNCDKENNEPTCWDTEMTEAYESTVQIQQLNDSSVMPVQSPNVRQTDSQANDLKEPEYEIRQKDEADLLVASRNQLQESVSEYLNEAENEQEKIEKEKAYIAKILDDGSSDENSFDNLSGNESESKENIDESNFLKSLEKMKELFSSDDEAPPATTDKSKPVTKPAQSARKPRPTVWKHEKFIQLHKFSMLSTEMSYQRQKRNRCMFLELFGEDSDEEHIQEYCCLETYRTSCVERISRWVVKYLMPYYQNRKIIGRKVFKTLAHHISDTIIDKIQYPDEWTIRYFVTRFFPPRKKYVCDADVLAFQFD